MELEVKMKVILWKVLHYPKYRIALLKRSLVGYLDWEKVGWAVEVFADACDFISTYRTIEIRMKYENWPK
jgi:hypothetical protein